VHNHEFFRIELGDYLYEDNPRNYDNRSGHTIDYAAEKLAAYGYDALCE
jgi:hypothetical protein